MSSYFNLDGIEFLRPQMFWLMLPVLSLVVVGAIRKVSSITSLIIRALFLSLLVLALADPARTHIQSGREYSVLFDVSYSVAPEARRALGDRLAQFLATRAASGETSTALEQHLNLITFARETTSQSIDLSESTATELQKAVDALGEQVDSGETNIAGAIQNFISTANASALVLLSDGYETAGDARQAARAAAAKGIRIFPLVPDDSAFREKQLTVSSLDAPITINSGEVSEIRATVRNSFSSNKKGNVEIWLGDKRLASQALTVPAGEERVVLVKTPVADGGLHRIRAIVVPQGEAADSKERSERYRWLSVKSKSKVLLLSGEKDDARVLRELLGAGGYALEDIIADGRTAFPTSFENFSAVIFNNVAKEQLPAGFLNKLKGYVSEGGGLLLVGGDRSYGLGNYIDTPLEEISPLKFVPPTTTKRRLNSAVVLLIDKSRSMAQQGKMAGAKAAAVSAIESLKDDDFVSVISFDADPFMVLQLKPAPEARSMAADRLRHLTPVGRTVLHPALGLAHQTLKRAPASRKHIILLTDGEFPYEENSMILAAVQRLRGDGITLSSIAVGVEADVPMLKTLAGFGKGTFYHTIDPSRLPDVFIQDIKVATGEKTMREQEDFPIAPGPSGLSSVAVARYPVLRGFVETLPKKGSRLELITKKEEKIFPVLGSWEYEKGRVVAFTSDANGRWSQPWLPWNEFPRFWIQALESVKSKGGNKTGEVDFDLRYSVESRNVVLDLSLFDDKLTTQAAPRIIARVNEPGGEQKQVVFQPLKKGRFQGVIENGRPGDYRLEIDYGNTKLPPLAITVSGDVFGEVPGRGINVQTLSDIAHLSGGVINPSPEQVSSYERKTEEKEHLFVPLAIAAFFVLLLEAFIRELGFGVLLGLIPSRLFPGSGKKTISHRPKGSYEPKRRFVRAGES